MNRQSVQKIVEETAVNLFAAYEMQGVTLESGTAQTPTIAGRMRFDLPQPGGAIVIASTLGFFARTRPNAKRVASLTNDSALERDWAQELANQLLGRLANRLVAFGINIEFATVTKHPQQTKVQVPNTEEPQPLIFRIGNDTVWIWLDGDGVHSDWLNGAAPPEGAVAPASEGDIIFF